MVEASERLADATEELAEATAALVELLRPIAEKVQNAGALGSLLGMLSGGRRRG